MIVAMFVVINFNTDIRASGDCKQRAVEPGRPVDIAAKSADDHNCFDRARSATGEEATSAGTFASARFPSAGPSREI